jgi:hypothetical protein
MTQITDRRTDDMKREMATAWDEYEADYRAEDWCTVVYEDEQAVVIADHKGYEFSEWESEFGDGFREVMHDLAGQLVDRRWPADYPVVFDKLEDN